MTPTVDGPRSLRRRDRAGARLGLIALVLVLVACGGDTGETELDRRLRVMVPHDWPLDEADLVAFSRRTEISVELARFDDPLRALAAFEVSPDPPPADLIIGIDEVSAALAELDALRAPAVDRTVLSPGSNRPAPGGGVALTTRDACVVLDRVGLEEAELDPPEALVDLTDPLWEGRLLLPDPTTSAEGRWLALVLAQRFPVGSALEWTAVRSGLLANSGPLLEDPDAVTLALGPTDGALVAFASAGWSAASARLLDELPDQPGFPPLAGSCLRVRELGWVARSSGRPEAADALMSELLGVEIQSELFDHRGGRPARDGVNLPPAYRELLVVPPDPLLPDPRFVADELPTILAGWALPLAPQPDTDG